MKYQIDYDVFWKRRLYENTLYAFTKAIVNCVDMKQYFFEKGINRLAIYGLGDMGLLLADYLLNNVEMEFCGIDRNADLIHRTDIEKYVEYNDNMDIDGVIVTSEFYWGEIYESLRKRQFNGQIILLRHMCDELRAFYS